MTLDARIGFDALFRHATMGILVADERGIILLANPHLLRQFGYEKEEELVGQTVEKLIPMRYHDAHLRHREDYRQQPRNRSMGQGLDLYGARKDGTELPVEVSLGNYETAAGKYVIAYVNDITRRKEAEQALRDLNMELEEKVRERTGSLSRTVEQLARQMAEAKAKDEELQRINNLLNNIWNRAGALLIVTDRQGIVRFFNPAAEKALGYTSEEVVGKESMLLFHDPEEVAARAEVLGEELGSPVDPGFETLVAKADLGDAHEYEWQYIRKDGSRLFVSLTITALYNQALETEAYLGVAVDISEKKKGEAELRKTLEKEKELSELKSRFVSMASHEFRTPLSTVLSSVYLISKYETQEDQPKREKHIRRIISSVNMLTDILNDFLSAGKIEEGRILVRSALFGISDHVKEVVGEMQDLLKAGQQVLCEHRGPDQVLLDPSLLKHIMMNLLSNAIKFSPTGSVIRVDTEVTETACRLTVKDQGIGISREDQQHLFERFFRGANASNIQGTGLGLHIVSKYAELMNGEVSCHSVQGEGTSFTVIFNQETKTDE